MALPRHHRSWTRFYAATAALVLLAGCWEEIRYTPPLKTATPPAATATGPPSGKQSQPAGQSEASPEPKPK
jgi:hypothetical protein